MQTEIGSVEHLCSLNAGHRLHRSGKKCSLCGWYTETLEEILLRRMNREEILRRLAR